jgi:methylated-DNA-protein-cysteine methyltransferase-like protein
MVAGMGITNGLLPVRHFSYFLVLQLLPLFRKLIIVRMNDFYNKVYETVRQIPPGRVTSYGAIARFLGTGMSARVVGWALNASHGMEPFVPAHRVVNRNGLLTGKVHFQPRSAMQEMLENEGVIVDDDAIVSFDECFWDPNKEL